MPVHVVTIALHTAASTIALSVNAFYITASLTSVSSLNHSDSMVAIINHQFTKEQRQLQDYNIDQ